MTDKPIWQTSTVTYENCPLALRVRPAIDSTITDSFPHLGIVDHKLAIVRSDGLPESGYNRSLAEFDAAVHKAIESKKNGLVYIVETFSGSRSYYACINDEVEFRNDLLKTLEKFRNIEVSIDCKPNRSEAFYRKYRNEFNW